MAPPNIICTRYANGVHMEKTNTFNLLKIQITNDSGRSIQVKSGIFQA